MPFSASTCLTDLGTTVLGGIFNIYSNVDNYTSPFQINVSYNSLFGPSCPYVMGNVPNGTTTIKIVDTSTKCCATLDLLSNDLCTTCELSFDSYQTNNVGIIVAGELTGSCENDITDYRIFWYGPNSSTNLAFTSGYGSTFSPYSLTHPLIGINSPMVEAGTYIPVIDKIKLNGLNYSQTGGTGYIQAELECFNAATVNVQPFTCDNGTVPLPNDYTHRVNFSAAAAGTIPLTLQSTFDLDITTNYFSWKFKSDAIPDSLKITFYGSDYTNPIILEYWEIGGNLSTSNTEYLTFPKSADTVNYFSKVTSLTSLSRNVGDYLILEVIPNQFNTQTTWDFYFTCMDSFDCDLCLYDYLNTPYKIKSSSITGITGSCSSIEVNFDVSGCTQSSITNSDIYKYQQTVASPLTTTSFNNTIYTDDITGLRNRISGRLDWNETNCGISFGINFQAICSPIPNTNIISFKKENTGPSGQGVIKMVFSSLSDLVDYKSSYDLTLPYSGTPSNPADPNYYRYFQLRIPKNATPNTNCGDGTSLLTYSLHYSSIVTTGTTGGNYTLNITMPTISNGIAPFDPCDINCQGSINNIVTTVNNSSTGATNVEDFTTNTGSKYIVPFGVTRYFVENLPVVISGNTIQGVYYLNNYLNSTIPFSGNSSPYTQIPSLSALTCNNFTSIGVSYTSVQFVYVYNYRVELTDPNNVKSFRILASPIVNGVPSNIFSDVVATVINGVLQLPTNPSYTF
jgi:hypothetical protein